MGMNSNVGLKPLNSNWQMWGGQGSQRQPSGSPNTSVADITTSQRDAWTGSRPSSGSWELAPTSEHANSPQKKDYQLDPQSPMTHGRQNRAPSGLSSRMDERASGVKSNTRYTSAPSPTAVGFNGNVQYGNQSNGTSGYDGSVDDLTMSLRGMVVNDDYSNQGSSYRQASAMPQPQPAPSVRPPPMMQPQQARPYNGYNPQGDYTTYYTGPSGLDYTYSYDSYRSNSEASVYGSPVPTSATPPTASVYNGMVTSAVHPVHADMRQAAGVFYDFSGSTRPAPSQYYYSTQPMMYATAPHSPMQSTTIGQMAPASLSDKKRELQYAIQQQQQLSHQLYASVRHSTPSPHGQPYGTPADYVGQMPMIMPGAAMFGTPGAGNQALTLFQQTMNHGRKLDAAVAPSITLRSPLLDEFRNNKARKWELKDIFGYIVEFSGDQHGSRFIQQKLETASSEEKQLVFDEIVPDAALQLTQDVFGNYVIQKLFEHGTQIQKTMLASTMESHIMTLSLQMYGCRVVQKAIEFVLPDQQAAFVKELESHVLRLVKDANGNHVVQKLLERVAPERLAFVQSFKGSVYDLSTHPYGCRVLQRVFEHMSEDQTRPLLDELHKYTINLMQDQFGNYVVQFVLERGPAQDRLLIITKLRGQMIQMAKHKFASNVCEKALVMADSENRRLLIDEMMTPKADGVSPIVTMMKDQYANYVLQRALTVVEADQKEALVSKIRPQLATMRRYSSAYSKHLISIERLIEKTAGQSLATDPNTTNLGFEGTHPEDGHANAS